MSLSMYQASVPVFVRGLDNLAVLLDQAEEFAAVRQIHPSVLIEARLFPDMFPLARQVQLASDAARRAVARLAGIKAPVFEDIEVTFADLHERIARTREFLDEIGAWRVDGSESREFAVKVGGQETAFTGLSYLLSFALPNFFFHVTTAYDILRHNGVPVGKADYLGRFDEHFALAIAS
ncbi:DUF1993 domain-containing protein [Pararobbsia silviterrae]|uniref:DUF1993 domain-containing protein n=1 Tax=Pararobbsia silviterrae TaxID=1792498 RepID=A0A494Y128_9BURK|nr:DUF1993 domain-containing protein [Pararobbsia silviterrae]RKP55708.1 DUF1993 domain-containing protein [Pararobbsia silviterrae]